MNVDLREVHLLRDRLHLSAVVRLARFGKHRELVAFEAASR